MTTQPISGLDLFGVNLRELFHLHTVNLSVAVWVGFLALFGIAVDDGVVMHTYIEQRFESDRPVTRDAVRACVTEAGLRRIRPCLMTTATTALALLPILTATGRGADLLLPMALCSDSRVRKGEPAVDRLGVNPGRHQGAGASTRFQGSGPDPTGQPGAHQPSVQGRQVAT